MSKSGYITARVEPKLKASAGRVLSKIGVSTSDAITMFLRQVVMRQGMPFDVALPNVETTQAIEELESPAKRAKLKKHAQIQRVARKLTTREVDELVLATVNAPYRRVIGAPALAGCLAKAGPGKWPVHVATFFTDVNPDLVLAFAAAHGISKSRLARAYVATKRATGEQNLALEAKLGSVASAAS